MKPEQHLWQLIRPFIPGHAERVENVVGVGMPDVHWTYENKSSWLELKVAKVPNQPLSELLEPSQNVWHRRNTEQGGRVFVLLRDGATLKLFRGLPASPKGVNYATVFSMTKPWNWQHFEEVVRSL